MVKANKTYDTRLSQLLNTAQGLFFQKGYEKTSVQNIIDAVAIAKGTFYHYFKSKEDLLEKLLERQIERIMDPINQMIEQEDLNALEKLNQIFTIGGMKKVKNKTALKIIARAMASDSNIRLKEKQKRITYEQLFPAYEKVIAQGLQEGLFDTLPAAEAAAMICNLQLGLFDRTMPMFIALLDHQISPTVIEEIVHSFEFAIARILGVAVDQIQIMNRDIFNQFTSEGVEP